MHEAVGPELTEDVLEEPQRDRLRIGELLPLAGDASDASPAARATIARTA
jgi:hypothetical protein